MRGARRIPAARHRDHDLRTRRDHVIPDDLTRARARHAEDVFSPGDPHLLRHPVAAVEQWVEPLEAGHARPGESFDPFLDRGQPRTQAIDQTVGIDLASERRADPADVVEHSVDG